MNQLTTQQQIPDLLDEVKQAKTSTELEKTLASLSPDAWLIANMKSRGQTLRQIYQHYCGAYSISEISYMIKQVTAANAALAIKNPDMLRQLLIDDLDDTKRRLNAGLREEIDEKTAAVFIKLVETKAKLLGVNAPEKVEVDITHTIKEANEALQDKLENFRKTRKIIDVTPTGNV